MIQIDNGGRTGNQLFIYAAVRAYMLENDIKEDVYICFKDMYEKKTDKKSFVNEISNFNTIPLIEEDKIKMNIKQRILDFEYRAILKVITAYSKIRKIKIQKQKLEIMEKILHKKMNKAGLMYYFPTNIEFYETKSKNIIFKGTFENHKIFDKYKKQIVKEIDAKRTPENKNDSIYQAGNKTNSVCVSIRRGDYLSKKYKNSFYICDEKYFENAKEIIEEKIANPQYIVFSDDVEWCKRNAKFPEGTLYESGSDSIQEKLNMMKNCKNFILSNSSFSWWAEYLSEERKEKIVIAPKIWNKFAYNEGNYQDYWIKI